MTGQTKALMEAYGKAAEQYQEIERQRREAMLEHVRELEKTIERLAASRLQQNTEIANWERGWETGRPSTEAPVLMCGIMPDGKRIYTTNQYSIELDEWYYVLPEGADSVLWRHFDYENS